MIPNELVEVRTSGKGRSMKAVPSRDSAAFNRMGVEQKLAESARQQMLCADSPGCFVVQQHPWIVLVGKVSPHIHYRQPKRPDQRRQPGGELRHERQNAVVTG